MNPLNIENQSISTSNYSSILHKAILVFLLITALLLRIIFFGYSPLNHVESENALNAGVVLDCFEKLSWVDGLWKLWHTFLNNNNPLMQAIIFNVPIAAVFGLNEISIRLNAVIGGFFSLLIVYFLIKRHADRATALFALALLAFNPFLIAFNRFGHTDSLQTAFLLAGLLSIDKFVLRSKPQYALLILSSFLFSIAFLLKYNAAVMILLMLILYYFFFGLKLKDIVLAIFLIPVFVGILFIDQTYKLMKSIFLSADYVKMSAGSGLGIFLQQQVKVVSFDAIFFLKAHVRYFEYTLFPLLTGILFWRKIENRFFRFLIVFSGIYFVCLIFQGRTFHRYLLIGILMATTVLAFPIKRFSGRMHYYGGIVFLALFVLWSFYLHRTYVSILYHHIPYSYIVQRANEIRGSGRILLFGRNAETEFYFSPDGKLIYDTRNDPCLHDAILVDKYPTWTDPIRKMQPLRANLSDPAISRSGDILVVTGKHMAGGEPVPRLNTADGKIRRMYRHELETVLKFYKEYNTDNKLQQEYALVEKIFLTNGSEELAALILRRN